MCHFQVAVNKANVCVSDGKKCSFFGKFGVLCCLKTLVLRIALFLPYYRRGILSQNSVPVHFYKDAAPDYLLILSKLEGLICPETSGEHTENILSKYLLPLLSTLNRYLPTEYTPVKSLPWQTKTSSKISIATKVH